MIARYFIVLLRRSLGFWLGTRSLLMLLEGGLVFSPVAATLCVALVTWLVWFDARAAGEHVLLANFGVSQVQCATVVATVAGTMETSVAVIAALAA